MSSNKFIVINGWTIFAHPLFLQEYEYLLKQVTKLKENDPINYKKKNVAKRFAAIHKLAFKIIPQDPSLPEYRQGLTLGNEHKHWFRAKFFQQYRLFFRFHSQSKIIVYAWVNDDMTKRAYNTNSDAYKVFEKMLYNGNPPNSWDDLVHESKKVSLSYNILQQENV